MTASEVNEGAKVKRERGNKPQRYGKIYLFCYRYDDQLLLPETKFFNFLSC
jgi:hypothetical protein